MASDHVVAKPPSEELRETWQRAAPSGRIVYDAIVLEGEEELGRTSSALFWSGAAAGLSMGFSLIVQGAIQAVLPDAAWRILVVKLGYAAGFLIVILGRQQLFTENTLTPVLPMLRKRKPGMLINTLRLWAVVLVGNLVGAALFGVVAARTSFVEPGMQRAFLDIASRAIEPGFGLILLRGIFAGWLIALLIWLLPYAESARVLVIIIITWIIGIAHFSHVIASSVEVFMLAAAGGTTWGHALAGFTVPALIGNIIGGLTLVTALAHAQVVSGEGADA